MSVSYTYNKMINPVLTHRFDLSHTHIIKIIREQIYVYEIDPLIVCVCDSHTHVKFLSAL